MTKSNGVVCILSLTLVLGGSSNVTHADEPASQEVSRGVRFDWLGYARGIPTAWSASRDTPRLEMAIFPRPVTTAGGEFALFTVRDARWVLRTGFSGFLEQDSTRETTSINSGPFASSVGRILWRGAYAYYLALELPALGAALCEGCTFEFTLGYRHESEHATASNYGGDSVDYSTQPYVGDAFVLDVAAAQTFGDVYILERVVGLAYLPDRSSYLAGVALDVHVRFTRLRRLHPFVSGYAEYRAGDKFRGLAYDSVYRARVLLGVALPSSLGDILVFAFGDVGHRYGVQAHTEEATLGVGVRLAVGRAWETP